MKTFSSHSFVKLVAGLLLGLMSGLVCAEDLIFQLEPTMKATVAATHPFSAGTKLDFAAKNFKPNELLLLQRCGDPCNTAKMVRIWKPHELAKRMQSITLSEPGQYYFWIMKTLDNGEVGPVFGESVTGDARAATVQFTSGTVVSVFVSDTLDSK
jgi:hypothetical protein